jgi:hypothetical protein
LCIWFIPPTSWHHCREVYKPQQRNYGLFQDPLFPHSNLLSRLAPCYFRIRVQHRSNLFECHRFIGCCNCKKINHNKLLKCLKRRKQDTTKQTGADEGLYVWRGQGEGELHFVEEESKVSSCMFWFRANQSLYIQLNCIGDVMVNVVQASSAVDRGFESRSGQTKDYNICICCFSVKHSTLSKSKDWLARNQNMQLETFDSSSTKCNSTLTITSPMQFNCIYIFFWYTT